MPGKRNKAKPASSQARGRYYANPAAHGSVNRQFTMPMSVSFPKNCIGFPDRLCTVLKYSQNNLFGAGSPIPTAQQFAINSAYDPDSSGAGHQPSFFDTFASVYGRYFVKAFKIEVEILNQSSSIGVFAVVNYCDQNIAANTVEQIIEAKYSKYSTLSVSTGNSAMVKISLPWMETMKLMGTPGLEADDNMYAAVNANPADIAWALIKMASVDGTTNMSAYGRTIIYQEVVFKDLLPQISS